MYKSKLQELCQRKAWGFPDYTTIKEGPGHSPSFKTTVTVNGISFDTPDFCKQLKESQSEAARLAYFHLADNPISSSTYSGSVSGNNTNLYNLPTTGEVIQPNLQEKLQTPRGVGNYSDAYGVSIGAISGSSKLDNMPPTRELMVPNLQEKSQTAQVNGNSSDATDISLDMQHVYKNQLQAYAQKRSLGLPEYACKREGPAHASRFSCRVTVAEETYESPKFFSTLKEAEHAAAKVALMSLLPRGVSEDNFLVYKNLLQELAQREGFCLPTYKTNSCGLSHMPTFVSTVDVKGEIFQGEEAKTKKQAEMNAAKVAYIIIKEHGTGQRHEFMPATCQLQEATSSSLKSTFSVDLQENVRLKSPTVLNMNVLAQEDNEQERAENQEASKKMSVSTLQAQIPCINPSSDTTRKRGASDIPYARLQNPSPSVPSSSKVGSSLCSAPSECISDLETDLKLEQPTETNTLQCKKVCVIPRTVNMKLPDGVVVFSDDKWIAIETGPPETTN